MRPFEANPQYKNLANNLREDNLIGTCFVGNSQVKGTFPPPEVKPTQIGYADVFPDNPYGIMRRAVLEMQPESTDRCQSKQSFSFKIAQAYLKKEGIKLKETSEGYLQLGNTVFKPLENHSSGYQKLDASGHQILINYRSINNPPLNLTQNNFTLKEVLENQENLDVIKDKIVLIGVDALGSAKDHFLTPYAGEKQELMPGVILHAQMASQIIKAALGERPLLIFWSVWAEISWIWAWSVLGGLFFWCLWKSPIYLALAASLSLLALYTFCYAFLAYNSIWIPFVPAAIVFLSTGCCVIVICAADKKRLINA